MLTPQQKWKLAHPERVREEARKYYEKHKEKIKKYRHSYYQRKRDEQLSYSGQYYRKNRDRILRKERDRYAKDSEFRQRKSTQGKKDKGKLRNQILKILSNKCAICDWADPRALQIDHVNGGGNLDRKANSSWGYHKRILEELEAGSKDYQLLCANHNCIKRIENKELGKKFVEDEKDGSHKSETRRISSKWEVQ